MVSSCENHSDESQIYSSRTAEWGPKWNFRPWKFTCKNCSNCYSLLPERKPITFGMEKKIEEEWCQYFSTERWGGGGRTTKRWPAPGAILVKKDPSGNKCSYGGGGYCNWLKRGGRLRWLPFQSPFAITHPCFEKRPKSNMRSKRYWIIILYLDDWSFLGKWPVEKKMSISYCNLCHSYFVAFLCPTGDVWWSYQKIEYGMKPFQYCVYFHIYGQIHQHTSRNN